MQHQMCDQGSRNTDLVNGRHVETWYSFIVYLPVPKYSDTRLRRRRDEGSIDFLVSYQAKVTSLDVRLEGKVTNVE